MLDRDRMVEVNDETATFVLSGTVSASDVSSMRRACRAIPARVRTLRLDLGDVDGFDAQVMDGVRGVAGRFRPLCTIVRTAAPNSAAGGD